MSWAGKGIHGEGSIDLKYLGHGRLIPIWPFLSTLELHNVKLGSRSVEYLKQLSVHARLRDIIWMENAITGFEMGSKLRQAVCLGLQVVHYELVKYPTSTVAAGPTALNAYKHGDVPSKVFLIAYGVEDTQQLAARNATYCSPIALEDGETVPFILPEEISRYMTGGGYCPMDGIEDGGAVWAEEW